MNDQGTWHIRPGQKMEDGGISRKRIDLESENANLLALLAKERDEFGKLETKIMAENVKIKAELLEVRVQASKGWYTPEKEAELERTKARLHYFESSLAKCREALEEIGHHCVGHVNCDFGCFRIIGVAILIVAQILK